MTGGANPMFSGDVSMFFTSQVQGFREELAHPIGLLQIVAIGISFLIAWLLARGLHHYFDESVEKAKTRTRIFKLIPAQFAKLLGYLFWLLLIWFSKELFIKFKMPNALLHMTLNLVGALIVIRFASFYLKSIFWSRFVYVVCLVVIFLRTFKLWDPTVNLLDSMTIELGKISISVWGLIEAIIIFILLYAAASVVNRFIAQWLMTSTKLTYSDRTLLLRVIRSATAAVVILISLGAAGIHMTAIAVTGGAIGLGIGVGLQKIGSNIISGIMLLISKPIRRDDVIAFEKSYTGAGWGWIARMDLMYVHLAMRSGSLLLPNAIFLTQKIENLSYDDSNVRLNIPFGIAYESDLNEAKTLALSAASSIDRILKTPEPKCLVMEYGDSTINLELRVWINDPKIGIDNVKDAALMAVWDSFHANGIEIAFPQRDLHIKSAVPFKILKDNAQPVAKDSLENTGNKGSERD